VKLLVVEDDADLAEALLAALRSARIHSEFCRTGRSAAELIELYAFDAAVIDRGLPDMDGLDLVRNLRRAGNRLPVIVLTAQSDVASRIDGLDAGADDYLGKPFLFAELKSRLNAVMRRTEQRVSNTMSCGNLAYDVDSHAATIDAMPIDLSPRERSLIEVLMRARGRPLSAGQLEDSLCTANEALTTNALEVSIHRLRRKLAAAGCSARITWIRGMGYCLKAGEP
jgi:DNA-binding response OmpR family regulator